MLDKREWMTNFVSIPIGNWLMAIVDDVKHWVEGIGDVLITTNIIIIAKVFYIPSLKRNLFSVRQFVSNGVVTLFDEDTFTMIDKNNNGKVAFKGCLDEKMYKLNAMVVPPKKQISYC